MAEGGTSRIAGRRSSALAEGGAEYAAKRTELIRIATTVFYEKGYAATTLGDIAAIFGTDRASLYYYVGSKEELLREALTGVAQRNVEAVEAIAGSGSDAVTRLRAMVELLTRSLVDDHPAVQVYIQEDLAALEIRDPDWLALMRDLGDRFEACFVTAIEEGIAEGTIRDDVPPGLLAASLFGMVMWTHRWFEPGKHLTADDLVRAFDTVFFEGAKRDR